MSTRSKTTARIATKAKLAQTTALTTAPVDDNADKATVKDMVLNSAGAVQLPLSPTHNALDIPPPALIKTIANGGFQFKTAADIANGKATQTLAYACMAFHALWRNDGHPSDKKANVPDLASVITKAGADNRTTLKAWFVEAILGERTEYENADKEAQSVIAWRTKTALIARGMSMAAILIHSGVKHTDFNVSLHCFEVHPSMLMMPGWSAFGILSRKGDKVALDQTPYAAHKGDDLQKFKASVDQLNKAMREQLKLKPARAKSGTKATPLSEQPAEMLAAECDAAKLITALRSVLDRMQKDKKLTPAAFAKPVWSDLTDIVHMNDGVQNSEAFRLYQETGIGDAAVVADADGNVIEQTPAAA